ncbi:hypothetical protein CVT25_013168 [Psilocybe cyanescens]|uniref:Uncharacterized protein n=1 Tax=Psilocybe cyanescens TaxID=93625 RepID=A0A409XCU6_PSICY|nr:hypothetical protein CVT25_013168 [Psilocybe cyanescens]
MSPDNPLNPLSATLGDVEVEGTLKGRKRARFYVQLDVDDRKAVMISTKIKRSASGLRWEWTAGNEIWFAPSSKIEITIYQYHKLISDKCVGRLGQTQVVDMIANDASFDLTNENGLAVPLRMKIALSPALKSDDDIENLLKEVDNSASKLKNREDVLGTASSIGQALQLIKVIMNNFSQVHPVLNASWVVVAGVYKILQGTDVQDKVIQELANTLREMLGTAAAVPDLPQIPNTDSVIDEISRQSLQVASLIHEYTKLSFLKRTAKIQLSDDLKSCILQCQTRCVSLQMKLAIRIEIDTYAQAKQIVRTLNVIKDDALATKIRKWLSAPDSSRNLNEADEKHQDGTCLWFLEGEQFLRWQKTPGLLWIKGKSGSGKSILCFDCKHSSVIKALSEKKLCLIIAYFFFDGRDSQSMLQLHENFIRSLIIQFSHHYGGLPGTLKSLFEHCGDHHQPSVSQLQNILQDILDQFSCAYIIIDALDECTDHAKTLDWISKLVVNSNQSVKNIHILVTSRPERDIEKKFNQLSLVVIDVAEATRQDIVDVLNVQMNSKFREYSQETQNKIKTQLNEGADGSFRWMALQLYELEKCYSEDAVMKQLARLPDGLNEIYDQILKAIDKKYHAETLVFLQWLAFSIRPIKVVELAETVTVDFDSQNGPVFNSKKRYNNPHDLLTRCSSLVIESNGIIKLSHFSVKEHLLCTVVNKDFKINKETSHAKIAEISIVYLLQFNSVEFLTKDMLESFPLAEYAAQHWTDHLRLGKINPALYQSVLSLLTLESAFTKWVQIHNIDTPIWKIKQNLCLKRNEIPSPLYYASLSGMDEVVKHLIKQKKDVNAQGGLYGNALQAACYKENEAIVKLLLKHGANVNAQGGEYDNALQAACHKGHEAIVKLLLKYGADVNTQGPYNNALQTACCKGHKTIVKLLLEHGVDVNAQGGWYGNALQATCYDENKAIVELQLEHGANVNIQDGQYGNALQAACYKDHEAIIELLLEHGADVNAQGGCCGNALQAACYEESEAIVKLLLAHGADVNAQGGKYGNALQAACYTGHEAIIKLLLEHDADVNAQGGCYGNAFQIACCKGYEAIVKLLLEHSADVNAQEEQYGNALQAACYTGYEAIVKLLLKHGANVNAQGGEYDNALQAACHKGHEAIVKLLLEHGADVNAQGGYYGNTLQAACYTGHEAIVKLLLEHGADVNAQEEEYGNALQAACYEDNEAVVKLLLEYGADVNAQGGSYDNALQAACYKENKVIVKLLLEHGADVNVQGEFYNNALQAACYKGCEAIVKLLLEHGADVNAQGGSYDNALQAACYEENETIVKLLLEHGADVNAQGEQYGNALQAACYTGHETIVKLLLEYGADVNVQGGCYGNAFQVACCKGYEAIVKLLLEYSADVNAQEEEYYGNALQAACYKGHEAIVKLLLEHGADVNAQGGYYGNALQAASTNGYKAVVILLQEKLAQSNANMMGVVSDSGVENSF